MTGECNQMRFNWIAPFVDKIIFVGDVADAHVSRNVSGTGSFSRCGPHPGQSRCATIRWKFLADKSPLPKSPLATCPTLNMWPLFLSTLAVALLLFLGEDRLSQSCSPPENRVCCSANSPSGCIVAVSYRHSFMNWIEP